jgi:hypothetical protein
MIVGVDVGVVEDGLEDCVGRNVVGVAVEGTADGLNVGGRV